jgi:hypothetical protein
MRWWLGDHRHTSSGATLRIGGIKSGVLWCGEIPDRVSLRVGYSANRLTLSNERTLRTAGQAPANPARPGGVTAERAAGYTDAAHAEHQPSIEARSSSAKLPVVFATNFFGFARLHAMVIAPMRTRFDQFGKQMVRTALETRGPVETDAEVTADTRRIDLWFMPDPARVSAWAPRCAGTHRRWPEHARVLPQHAERRGSRRLPDQARRVPPLPVAAQDAAAGPDPVGHLVGPSRRRHRGLVAAPDRRLATRHLCA